MFERIIRDDLTKDALIIFLGANITNFFNLLFHLFLVRNLSPVDFGIFNSLISIFMLFSLFPGAVSLVISRFISRYRALGDFYKVKKFIIHFWQRVIAFALLILLFLILFSKPLSDFFRIPDGKNFSLLAFLIFSGYISSLPSSALQGLERFLPISIISVSGGLVKLGTVFLLIKLGVEGALWSFLSSNIFSLILAIWFLIPSLPRIERDNLKNISFDSKEVYNYFFPVILATLIQTCFLNIDMILVKRLFNPLEAGYYAISQLPAKIVFFFSSAIVTVMFPKVARLQAKGSDTKTPLKKSLFFIGFLSSLLTCFFLIFPNFGIKILVGKTYSACIMPVRLFVINMVLFTLLTGFINYYLSLNAIKFLYLFLVGLILEIILISLFHQSLLQVLSIIFFCFLSLFLLNLWKLK